MEMIRAVSGWTLLASWVLFSGMLAWNHGRVRAQRRRLGIPEEKPAIRDVRSMHGLALEGLSFLIAFAFWQGPQASADWRHAVSIAAGLLSVVVLGGALRQLGLQWRIKAVVTDDHQLVTGGPYALVRHPVFLSLFCLLIATVSLGTSTWAAAGAIVVCIYGTEIRIRAEDGLLARRFGQKYLDYQSRVAAILPGIR